MRSATKTTRGRGEPAYTGGAGSIRAPFFLSPRYRFPARRLTHRIEPPTLDMPGGGPEEKPRPPDVSEGDLMAPGVEAQECLRDLEIENSRLRKGLSDLTLDKLICRRLLAETSKPRASRCLEKRPCLGYAAACEARRRDYNEERPHSAIGNKAPIELADRSVSGIRPALTETGWKKPS
jgi:Integrase core domain